VHLDSVPLLVSSLVQLKLLALRTTAMGGSHTRICPLLAAAPSGLDSPLLQKSALAQGPTTTHRSLISHPASTTMCPQRMGTTTKQC